MKVLLDWLLLKRQRLVVAAMLAAAMMPIVGAALLSIETVRRGVLAGCLSAALGIGGFALLALALRVDVATLVGIGAATFASGVAIGALLRRAGTLTFAYQATVLIALAVVLLLDLFGPDPRSLFDAGLREVSTMLRSGGADEQQIADVMAQSGSVLLAAAVFSHLAGTLLLGYWWRTLAAAEKRFGAEFRELRLGRVLGMPLTLVLVAGLVFAVELVQNLAPLAMLAFVLQGLAVVHAWAYARNWHPGYLAPLYVMLAVPPLMVLTILPLGTLGLVDNWLNLRARFRSRQ
jgi:hypothetical protein